MIPSSDLTTEQSRLFKHTKVLRDRIQRHVEWCGKFGNPGFLLGEARENCPTGGIGERGVNTVKCF